MLPGYQSQRCHYCRQPFPTLALGPQTSRYCSPACYERGRVAVQWRAARGA